MTYIFLLCLLASLYKASKFSRECINFSWYNAKSRINVDLEPFQKNILRFFFFHIETVPLETLLSLPEDTIMPGVGDL